MGKSIIIEDLTKQDFKKTEVFEYLADLKSKSLFQYEIKKSDIEDRAKDIGMLKEFRSRWKGYEKDLKIPRAIPTLPSSPISR